jgi:hypothetical protein
MRLAFHSYCPQATAFRQESIGPDHGTALPQSPGVHRNSLNLPGARNARIELRVDAYNIFNNLNLNPNSISNNIGSSNFGTITSALAARVFTLGVRFSF